jgi:hypothetical protein
MQLPGRPAHAAATKAVNEQQFVPDDQKVCLPSAPRATNITLPRRGNGCSTVKHRHEFPRDNNLCRPLPAQLFFPSIETIADDTPISALGGRKPMKPFFTRAIRRDAEEAFNGSRGRSG